MGIPQLKIKKRFCCCSKTGRLTCPCHVIRYGYRGVTGSHYGNRNDDEEEEDELCEEEQGQETETEETTDTRKR